MSLIWIFLSFSVNCSRDYIKGQVFKQLNKCNMIEGDPHDFDAKAKIKSKYLKNILKK